MDTRLAQNGGIQSHRRETGHGGAERRKITMRKEMLDVANEKTTVSLPDKY